MGLQKQNTKPSVLFLFLFLWSSASYGYKNNNIIYGFVFVSYVFVLYFVQYKDRDLFSFEKINLT